MFNEDDPSQDIKSLDDIYGKFKKKKLPSGRMKYTYYKEELDILGEVESRRKIGEGLE